MPANNVKHKDLVKRYHAYTGEKTTYINFRNRVLNCGYGKEEAIVNSKLYRGFLPKTKIDDIGRVCTQCGIFKERKEYSRTRVGVNNRTPDCLLCRQSMKRAYRETAQGKQKDKEYKLLRRSLIIGRKIRIIKELEKDLMIYGAVQYWKVIDKKASYILQSTDTGYYRNYVPKEGEWEYIE